MNFANVTNWTIPEGTVNKVTDSLGRVIWEKQGGHDYSQDYFFVEDASGDYNTLSITKNVGSNAPIIRVYYSTDQVNWNVLGNTSTTPLTLTIEPNHKVYLKATTNYWAVSGANNDNGISCSGYFNIGGNIMSLLNGDSFLNTNLVSGTNDYAFRDLFENEQNMINANNLILPNTVTRYCYDSMFWRCNKLISTPKLPATTLANYCYYGMFQYCTSLTTAPTLPATSLAEGCYRFMFQGCTGLTTAPALPATTLAHNCYQSMFNDCKGLTTTPALPATTLADNCYNRMFSGCTSLNNVTSYANDISATSCISNWLFNVAATGDFYNLGSAVYPSGVSGIPSGWTEHNSL